MSAAVTRMAAAAVSRRPVSFVTRIRSVCRAMEAHPYERFSVTQTPAKADWPQEFKWLGSKVVMYFPSIGLLLGWPLIAQQVLDGHI